MDSFLGFIRLNLSDSSLVPRIFHSHHVSVQADARLGTVSLLSWARAPFGTRGWAVPGLVMEAITWGLSYARHCSSMQVICQAMFSLVGHVLKNRKVRGITSTVLSARKRCDAGVQA